MQTRTVAAERQGYRPPMVFKFKRQARSSSPGRTRQTLLSFFDTAGEDLTTMASIELNGRYLEAADAVILILDPLQMPGGRQLAAREALPQDPRPEDDPYSVLQRITEMLQAGHRDRRVRKPLAVVFTKLDALWHEFPEGSRAETARAQRRGLRRAGRPGRAPPGPGPAARLGRAADRPVSAAQLPALPVLRGVRARGDPDSGQAGLDVVQPYRVGDPILWLLSKAHMVPVIRRR